MYLFWLFLIVGGFVLGFVFLPVPGFDFSGIGQRHDLAITVLLLMSGMFCELDKVCEAIPEHYLV